MLLAFTIPSSVASQINSAPKSKSVVALCETPDEAIVLKADTRLLAQNIFNKVMSKQLIENGMGQ